MHRIMKMIWELVVLLFCTKGQALHISLNDGYLKQSILVTGPRTDALHKHNVDSIQERGIRDGMISPDKELRENDQDGEKMETLSNLKRYVNNYNSDSTKPVWDMPREMQMKNGNAIVDKGDPGNNIILNDEADGQIRELAIRKRRLDLLEKFNKLSSLKRLKDNTRRFHSSRISARDKFLEVLKKRFPRMRFLYAKHPTREQKNRFGKYISLRSPNDVMHKKVDSINRKKLASPREQSTYRRVYGLNKTPKNSYPLVNTEIKHSKIDIDLDNNDIARGLNLALTRKSQSIPMVRIGVSEVSHQHADPGNKHYVPETITNEQREPEPHVINQQNSVENVENGALSGEGKLGPDSVSSNGNTADDDSPDFLSMAPVEITEGASVSHSKESGNENNKLRTRRSTYTDIVHFASDPNTPSSDSTEHIIYEVDGKQYHANPNYPSYKEESNSIELVNSKYAKKGTYEVTTPYPLNQEQHYRSSYPQTHPIHTDPMGFINQLSPNSMAGPEEKVWHGSAPDGSHNWYVKLGPYSAPDQYSRNTVTHNNQYRPDINEGRYSSNSPQQYQVPRRWDANQSNLQDGRYKANAGGDFFKSGPGEQEIRSATVSNWAPTHSFIANNVYKHTSPSKTTLMQHLYQPESKVPQSTKFSGSTKLHVEKPYTNMNIYDKHPNAIPTNRDFSRRRVNMPQRQSQPPPNYFYHTHYGNPIVNLAPSPEEVYERSRLRFQRIAQQQKPMYPAPAMYAVPPFGHRRRIYKRHAPKEENGLDVKPKDDELENNIARNEKKQTNSKKKNHSHNHSDAKDNVMSYVFALDSKDRQLKSGEEVVLEINNVQRNVKIYSDKQIEQDADKTSNAKKQLDTATNQSTSKANNDSHNKAPQNVGNGDILDDPTFGYYNDEYNTDSNELTNEYYYQPANSFDVSSEKTIPYPSDPLPLASDRLASLYLETYSQSLPYYKYLLAQGKSLPTLSSSVTLTKLPISADTKQEYLSKQQPVVDQRKILPFPSDPYPVSSYYDPVPTKGLHPWENNMAIHPAYSRSDAFPVTTNQRDVDDIVSNVNVPSNIYGNYLTSQNTRSYYNSALLNPVTIKNGYDDASLQQQTEVMPNIDMGIHAKSGYYITTPAPNYSGDSYAPEYRPTYIPGAGIDTRAWEPLDRVLGNTQEQWGPPQQVSVNQQELWGPLQQIPGNQQEQYPMLWGPQQNSVPDAKMGAPTPMMRDSNGMPMDRMQMLNEQSSMMSGQNQAISVWDPVSGRMVVMNPDANPVPVNAMNVPERGSMAGNPFMQMLVGEPMMMMGGQHDQQPARMEQQMMGIQSEQPLVSEQMMQFEEPMSRRIRGDGEIFERSGEYGGAGYGYQPQIRKYESGEQYKGYGDSAEHGKNGHYFHGQGDGKWQSQKQDKYDNKGTRIKTYTYGGHGWYKEEAKNEAKGGGSEHGYNNYYQSGKQNGQSIRARKPYDVYTGHRTNYGQQRHGGY